MAPDTVSDCVMGMPAGSGMPSAHYMGAMKAAVIVGIVLVAIVAIPVTPLSHQVRENSVQFIALQAQTFASF